MKELFFNLNFDDYHPQNDAEGDFGGLGGQAHLFFEELYKEFPSLVITMFTTPNWIDRPMTMPLPWYHLKKYFGIRPIVPCRKGEPYRIDKHSEWCEWTRKKVSEGRMEIMLHGYEHHNPNSTIHGQEFLDMEYEESKRRIVEAERLFGECGIPFVKGFRPPGWGYSGGLLRALKDLKYEIVGLFPSHFKLSTVSNVGGLLVPPQNASIHEPLERILEEAERTGAVFLKGHIAYRYGGETIENGLSEKNKENLKKILRELGGRYDVRYVGLYDFTLSHRK